MYIANQVIFFLINNTNIEHVFAEYFSPYDFFFICSWKKSVIFLLPDKNILVLDIIFVWPSISLRVRLNNLQNWLLKVVRTCLMYTLLDVYLNIE